MSSPGCFELDNLKNLIFSKPGVFLSSSVFFISFCTSMTGYLVAGTEVANSINRALNRPTFESSYYKLFYSCGGLYASKAVDGNSDPVVANCHCFHTSDVYGEANWMAVDLGEKFKIDYTIVYGRKVLGERLDKFYAGLTNIFPTGTTVQLYSYPLCGRYPGSFPDSRMALMKCNYNLPYGRYFIIQMNPKSGDGKSMAVCELEVYDLPSRSWFRTIWKRKIDVKLQNMAHMIMKSIKGILSCVLKCIAATNRCDTINHDPKTGMCEFNRHINGYDESQLMQLNDWEFWTATND